MSISYDVGFRRKPIVEELDEFMQSLGFRIEPPSQRRGRFIRVYTFFDESQAPKPIDFFYKNVSRDSSSFFGNKRNEVKAYGALQTPSTEEAVPDHSERERIVNEIGINREEDYYEHLATERRKFYKTALAIRNRFEAIVLSEQTGEEIDPDRNPFAWIGESQSD